MLGRGTPARPGAQRLHRGSLLHLLDDDYRGFTDLLAGHIATAITNARAHEQERRRTVAEEARRRLESLMEVMPIGVCEAHDPECRTITCNPAGNEMFGLVRGTNASKSVLPGEQPAFRVFRHGKEVPPGELPMQQAVAKGVEVRDTEMDLVFADGAVKNLHVYAAPLFDEQGKIKGGFATVVDITPYRRLEAVAAAEAFRPDAVLLDIGLPKLSGYDAARRIRGEAWGRGMVLIALTGWGQEEDRRCSREAGFDFHLVKPVEPAALQQLLGELVTP